jgi:Uma2 family endonuclease
MIAQTSPVPLTPDAYLAFEAQSDIKHEYINGQAYAMAGTTDDHNTIALNAALLIRNHLRIRSAASTSLTLKPN